MTPSKTNPWLHQKAPIKVGSHALTQKAPPRGMRESKCLHYLDYGISCPHIQMQRGAEDLLAGNNELLQGTPEQRKTKRTGVH